MKKNIILIIVFVFSIFYSGCSQAPVVDPQTFKELMRTAELTNEGKYSLGVCLVNGCYGEQDIERGLKLLHESANSGFEKAKKYLVEYYLRPAKNNNPEWFSKSEGINPEWVYELARAGDPEAQAWVGALLSENKEYLESYKWYSKSAKQGNPRGQVGLAFLYMNDLGLNSVSRINARMKAFDLVRKAAAQNEPVALYFMAIYYGISGVDGKFDLKKALDYAERSTYYEADNVARMIRRKLPGESKPIELTPENIVAILKMDNNGKDVVLLEKTIEDYQGSNKILKSLIMPVTELLSNKSDDVRSRAVRILRKIGYVIDDEIPILIKALKDKNINVQMVSASILGKTGQSKRRNQVIDAFLETMQTEEKGQVINTILDALRKLNPRSNKVRNVVFNILKEDVYFNGLYLLGDMGTGGNNEITDFLLDLIEGADSRYRDDTVDALTKLEDEAKKYSIDKLIKMLKAKHPRVQKAAAEILRKYGFQDEKIIEALNQAIDGEFEPTVRKEFQETLNKLEE